MLYLNGFVVSCMKGILIKEYNILLKVYLLYVKASFKITLLYLKI